MIQKTNSSFCNHSNTDLGLTRFRRGLQSSAGHTEAQITS
jgi:hypothetical protein